MACNFLENQGKRFSILVSIPSEYNEKYIKNEEENNFVLFVREEITQIPTSIEITKYSKVSIDKII